MYVVYYIDVTLICGAQKWVSVGRGGGGRRDFAACEPEIRRRFPFPLYQEDGK